jgi:hypothetical protein
LEALTTYNNLKLAVDWFLSIGNKNILIPTNK